MSMIQALVPRIDDSTSGILLVGHANVGSIETEQVWRIQKLSRDIEGNVIVQYAGGQSGFNYAWTARNSLTYS
jgi:23S rRNA-/tRNA-specific pseudouridylate synthase